jgi:hypothetical protein
MCDKALYSQKISNQVKQRKIFYRKIRVMIEENGPVSTKCKITRKDNQNNIAL